MAVQATFRAMGLRSEKAVSAHLLLENAYESNLVSDISKVDCLAGSLDRTHLRPLPGLPTFVDDVYIFGYLRREDCVFHGGLLSCTTGEDSSAKHTIARISTAVHDCMGNGPRRHYPWPHAGKHRPHNRSPRQRRKRRHPSDSLQDRVRHRQKGTGKVARAIPGYRTGRPLRGKGRRVRNPYGRAASLLACLRTPAVGPRLRHLLYRLHTGFLGKTGGRLWTTSALPKAFASKATWRPPCAQTSPRYWRIPIALGAMSAHGCAQAKLGTRSEGVQQGHIELRGGRDSRTTWWPHSRLCRLPERPRRTFLHPDVQARSCTRIEVSLRLPRGRPLGEHSQRSGGGSLGTGSPSDLPGLFVVQPPAKQWENLAACLDRCLVLADRPRGSIFVS